MNNYFKIFFLILFFNNSANGQNKIIYVNENLELISKEDYYNKKNNSDFLYSQYDSDTLIIKTKAKRQNKGILDESIRIRIKDYINNIGKNENKITNDDIIVINYYPGLDNCNKGSGNDFLINKYATYTGKIKKIKNVKQFYFYKDIGNTKKYGEKLIWFKDSHNIFEKLFFKIHYPCGSYLIIFPDKTYVTYFGEYNLDNIFKELESKKRLDKKN